MKVMKLHESIDFHIQSSLDEEGIKFSLNSEGRLSVSHVNYDPDAKAGMVYLIPEQDLPKGELPFIIISAPNVFGVFIHDGYAAIIEVNGQALV
jgi:hypothetical protein